VRAILFDLHGQAQGHAAVVIREPDSPHPGWVEQDAEYLWDSLCNACRQLWTDNNVKDRIAAMAVSTMRSTVVAVDASGNALRPAIIWPDQRRTRGVPPVSGWNGLLHRIAGVRDTVAYFQAEAEANWLATYEPDTWSATHRYLLLSGYLNYRLTGEFRDSTGSQVGYVPFDFKHRRWAHKSSWKWQALPWVRPEQLPELVRPGEQIGEISSVAAEQTGLPPGTPVIAAAADKACEVLGAGATQVNTACLSYGTAATVNVTSREYLEPIRMVPPYPSAIPDAWNLEIQISRGFWLVSWFKAEFGQPEIERAAALGVAPERLMDELLEKSVPGAMGLLAQPYWSPGLRSPGPEARGAIVGFSSIHTRADVYRALLEGIAYAWREGKERIEQRAGHKVERLRVAGGGSRGDLVMQLTADIFGLPVARPHTSETSALGAAINAAVGHGLYPDYGSATAAMTHTGDVFDPDIRTSRLYDSLYKETYLPLYAKLRPIYRSMRRLTGFRP
ncbi:MAG: FGGY-family carbohydrate kinase, partial [Gammaproteobacteria bacterium]|nr:FGGY-family carbohydrate kinase [Gammaproteobacteria bacterium]